MKDLKACWVSRFRGKKRVNRKGNKTLRPKVARFGSKGKAAIITFLQSPKYSQHDKMANVKEMTR